VGLSTEAENWENLGVAQLHYILKDKQELSMQVVEEGIPG
jgi:hypothetical protein